MDAQNQNRIKIRTQRTIVVISVVLMAGKFLAFALTNSVGVLTDAMESIVNVVAGAIGLYSIYVASKPRDDSHPFGHGKVELISASAEGLMIMGAGAFIIYEGVQRLFHPAAIAKLDVGILIVALAGAVNFVMGWYSIRIGRRYNSDALVASGKHLKSDTYSSIGLVAGLGALYFTGWTWLDSVLAFVFGSIIVVTGIGILRRSIANLIDEADYGLLSKMTRTIAAHRRDDWIDVHNLKTIRYGGYLYIDCDLTVPWYYNIVEGHETAKQLRETLASDLDRQIIISIHTDPCMPTQCVHCLVKGCPHRAAPFESPLELTLWEVTRSDDERETGLEE